MPFPQGNPPYPSRVRRAKEENVVNAFPAGEAALS